MSGPVSVILPAYNEKDFIGPTLESLVRQRRPADEIVVADGGSTDGTADVARAFAFQGAPIRVVENAARRVGAGRNRAIAAARFPLLACIDAGNTADSLWLQRLTEAFERGSGERIVVGRILPEARSRFEACVAGVVYPHLLASPPAEGCPGGPAAALGISSSSMLLTRSVWEHARGYPEWLEASEDKLFAKKILSLGVQVIWEPEAVVHHHLRGHPLALLRQFLRYGRGSGLSGQTPADVITMAIHYGVAVALGLTALSVEGPLLQSLAASLIGLGGGLHLTRQGYRPYQATRGILTPAALVLVPIVLLTRDLGSILGHAMGNLERCLRPGTRRLVRGYVS